MDGPGHVFLMAAAEILHNKANSQAFLKYLYHTYQILLIKASDAAKPNINGPGIAFFL